MPKKILAICSNFYKTVKQKRGPSDAITEVVLAYEVAQYSFSDLSINYVAINKHSEKLPPQLYWIKMKIYYGLQ